VRTAHFYNKQYKMKFFQFLSGILAASIILGACNNIDFRKTSVGIPYKVFSSNKGDSVHINYFVKYQVIQKIKDSVIYNTYWDVPFYEQVQPINRKLTYTDIRGNVMEILPKVKTGDSIYIVQSTDSMLKENAQLEFKKGQELVTTIRVVDVFKNVEDATTAQMKDNEPKIKAAIQKATEDEKTNLAQFKADSGLQKQVQKDDQIIENYLRAHNIQAQKTDWGVYVQVLNPGTGPKPTIGKFVNVKYAGSHFNGEEFDSGVFPLQIGTPGAVKGFENGVMQLGQGGKAKIFIPSTLAYGAGGRTPTIQPNENLIFDIEVLEVSDRPIRQQQQPVNVDTSSGRK
jgi:FKBP-type peptidyl-prolyl cis-trans isomerase FkpA